MGQTPPKDKEVITFIKHLILAKTND